MTKGEIARQCNFPFPYFTFAPTSTFSCNRHEIRLFCVSLQHEF
ncbi:hypothetical protein HMPREF9136_0091 [Prevotella dentalis DSM 3688]|uniref:Uncharacterized protein n=1 Tax=Prevotella dentalis (strain ATCC 49559 / DSM 3688 / JCM 13448 / NCTC 12043 / ES 2772) TaxID=908937 RepID=F9CZR4_PREDD|nr:hypothetical protein HMPREF9136_0091 [Prevotella dentalis DSM 3688]